MCGRFSLTSPVEALRRLFGFPQSPNLMPRYNIPPTTEIAAVRLAGPDTAGERELFFPQWGLIPSWAKSTEFSVKMINARSETVAEKPAFRAAYKSRRCLIPANSFFEWQKLDKGKKQPWLIGVEGSPLFAFAGLWERWQPPEGDGIESCTILTTASSESIRFIHHRMPVILNAADHQDWLSGDRKSDLLRPYPSDELYFHPVSSRVGNVRNDDSDLLTATDLPSGQPELF